MIHRYCINYYLTEKEEPEVESSIKVPSRDEDTSPSNLQSAPASNTNQGNHSNAPIPQGPTDQSSASNIGEE